VNWNDVKKRWDYTPEEAAAADELGEWLYQEAVAADPHTEELNSALRDFLRGVTSSEEVAIRSQEFNRDHLPRLLAARPGGSATRPSAKAAPGKAEPNGSSNSAARRMH